MEESRIEGPSRGSPTDRCTRRGSVRDAKGSGETTYSVVNLREPADLDDTVKAWLTESYGYVTDE